MDDKNVQGSPEWLENRRKYIGASDAPVIMGVSPWSTPYKLFEDKMGISSNEGSDFIKNKGHRLEIISRELFEKEFNIKVTPQVVYSKDKSFMMCSLDGLSDDKKLAVEIKYAGKDKHEMARNGKIPECYYPQLQHQLACTGLNSIWYCSYNGDEIINVLVDRDEKYIEDMIEKEEKFWHGVQTFTPPPLTNKDYVVKENTLWLDYAIRLREIDNFMKSLSSEKKFIRESLIEDCNGQSSKGHGVSLSKRVSQGKVDYASIPELEQVNLDEYRPMAKDSWTMTVKSC